jgi:competence protein ComEC
MSSEPSRWTLVADFFRRLGSPLVLVCAGALGGIGLGESFPHTWAWASIALGFGAAGWWLPSSRVLLALTSIFLFAFLHSAAEHDPLRSAMKQRQTPLAAEAQGVVADAPVGDPSGRFWRFPLHLETLQHQSYPAADLYVRLNSSRPPQYGDRVTLQGHLQAPAAARNPGEFDWAEYLHRQGYSAEFVVETPTHLTVLDSTGGNFIVRHAMAARDWIGRTVTADLEADPAIAATVRTMVLGTQESTPQDVEDAFVESGTMHVFAVSGLHVALFGWVLIQLLAVLRVPLAWRVALTILLMFFYVYITGLRASAWRAAFMASIILLGPLLLRQGHIFNSLSFAAICLLGLDTQLLFQPGFQLSFGVVFMLAVLSRPLINILSPWFLPDPFIPKELLSQKQRWSAWTRKVTIESIIVSLCATIGSAPLMLHHFGMLAPVGVFANLLLVPISSAILFVACASLLTASLHLAVLSAWANNTNWLLATLSISSAKFFASVPGGHFRLDSSHWFSNETARITVLAFPNGGSATQMDLGSQQWLVDTGGRNSFLRTQRPYLLRYPLTALDGVLLTHNDADHIGATAVLRTTFPVTQIIAQEDLKAPGSVQPQCGETVVVRPDAQFTVLYPPPDRAVGLADDQCSVVRWEIDGWKILLLSDAGFIAEKWLLEHRIDVRADVLIKGWHESDYSGLPEFINAVQPRAIGVHQVRTLTQRQAVQAWMAQVGQKGIPVFNQEQSGAIEISLSPQELLLRGFMNHQTLRLLRRDERAGPSKPEQP